MAHYPLISRIYIAAVITTGAAMTAGLLLLHWAELLDDAGMIAILDWQPEALSSSRSACAEPIRSL